MRIKAVRAKNIPPVWKALLSHPVGETAFGLAVGGGLALAVSPRARLFVEPMYRIAFTAEESTKYVPIKIGVVIGNKKRRDL